MSSILEKKAKGKLAPLTPKLSGRWALGWPHAGLCCWFGAFFLYLNYIPVFHTDIWCHVHYGQWILENGQLPQEDPFLPLAEGVRVVDNAWLSQVLFAAAFDAGSGSKVGGAAFLSHLFALTVFATFAVYTRVFYLLSGRIAVALAGFVLLLGLGWTRHGIIRPEMFGALMLALLLWSIVRLDPWRSRAKGFSPMPHEDNHWPTWLWLAIPLLFVIWANMHGSFLIGVAVLGCHALGRMIEVLGKTRRIDAVLCDATFRRWTLLTELAVLSTLVNPYGLDLLIETVRFGRNENLRDVLEWFPLKLTDLEGIQMAVALIGMMFLIRGSRQRIHPTDVSLLLLFGVATAPTVRMIGWFAPMYALTMVPHLGDLWSRWSKSRPKAPLTNTRPARKPHFGVSLVCGLIVWCFFSLSPISRPLLGGKTRGPAQVHSSVTPFGVADYLRANPPQGLIFAPQWWGDWLAWKGHDNGRPNAKKRWDVFMTTMIHLAPRQVWRDYMRVARAQTGWEQALDRYAVRDLVVHKQLQPRLFRQVRRSSTWRIEYEDDIAIVARRQP